jgi:hypothetical protein
MRIALPYVGVVVCLSIAAPRMQQIDNVSSLAPRAIPNTSPLLGLLRVSHLHRRAIRRVFLGKRRPLLARGDREFSGLVPEPVAEPLLATMRRGEPASQVRIV